MLRCLVFNTKEFSCEKFPKPLNIKEKLIFSLLNNDFTVIQKMNNKNQKLIKTRDYKICFLVYCLKFRRYNDFETLLTSELSEQYEQEYSQYITKLHIDFLIVKGKFHQALEKIDSSNLPKTLETCQKHLLCLYTIKDSSKLSSTIKNYKKLLPTHKSIFKLYSSLSKENHKKCLEIIASYSLTSLAPLKAFCHLKLRNFSESLSIIEDCLQKNNLSEFTWHLAGILFYEIGNFNDAFYCFSKCLRFQPEKVEYLFNLGKTYEKKNFEIFQKILKKILKIDPNFQQISEIFYPVIDFVEIDLENRGFVQPSIIVKDDFLPQGISEVQKSKKMKKHKKVKAFVKGSKKIHQGVKSDDERCALALASLSGPIKKVSSSGKSIWRSSYKQKFRKS
jgi:tetratricopeptide (TPR) repeat protein